MHEKVLLNKKNGMAFLLAIPFCVVFWLCI